jgi:hypothetical protein
VVRTAEQLEMHPADVCGAPGAQVVKEPTVTVLLGKRVEEVELLKRVVDKLLDAVLTELPRDVVVEGQTDTCGVAN